MCLVFKREDISLSENMESNRLVSSLAPYIFGGFLSIDFTKSNTNARNNLWTWEEITPFWTQDCFAVHFHFFDNYQTKWILDQLWVVLVFMLMLIWNVPSHIGITRTWIYSGGKLYSIHRTLNFDYMDCYTHTIMIINTHLVDYFS